VTKARSADLVRRCFRSLARLVHNAAMTRAHDFKRALTRTIEPTGGPGVELATLEDVGALHRSDETMAPGATACYVLGIATGTGVRLLPFQEQKSYEGAPATDLSPCDLTANVIFRSVGVERDFGAVEHHEQLGLVFV